MFVTRTTHYCDTLKPLYPPIVLVIMLGLNFDATITLPYERILRLDKKLNDSVKLTSLVCTLLHRLLVSLYAQLCTNLLP
jgi:hypothetical protein